MEHGSENNGTLIDTLSLILAMFQLLICNLHQYFFVVPDKDCDIAVEIAISNLCDSTFCSIKILMQKLLMKMSLLVDHKKAQSLPFQIKFVSCKSGK